jgi:hypothetical protein
MQNIHKRALEKDNRARTRVAFSHALKQAAKQNICGESDERLYV